MATSRRGPDVTRLRIARVAVAAALATTAVACAAPAPVAEAASSWVDLAGITIAADGPSAGYDREADFGSWLRSGPGCDVRDVVLRRDLENPTVRRGCDVTAGTLYSPYTGATATGAASRYQIDHRVPLSLAWRTGARAWTRPQRVAFANDLSNLVAVEAAVNTSKGDSGPEEWMPRVGRCQYAQAFVGVVKKYRLTVTAARARTLKAAC